MTASTTLSNTIDTLVSLGLIDKPYPQSFHGPPPPSESKTSQPLSFLAPLPGVTKKQPPLFWKAFAFALKGKFTISGSLYDDGRALFLAELGEVGIPVNSPYPKEVTNYEVFVRADAMQKLNKPAFSLGGGSYFDFLNSYLRHAGSGQQETSELKAARTALDDAKVTKNEYWQQAVDRYNASIPDGSNASSTTKTLVEFLATDKQYQDAWEVEQKAAQQLFKVMTPEMSSLSRQIDLLRLADMRLEPQTGNNMRVSVENEDWLTLGARGGAAPVPDEKFIYYQPWYSLPAYAADAKSWSDASGTLSSYRDGPYEIPLGGIWDRQWADLGHPGLDDAPPAEKLTDQQKNLLNSLTVNLTFLQRPGAYEVRRGLWDVPNPRVYSLPDSAAGYLSQPVCRTTKMIFAYGLEIEIVLPEPAAAAGAGGGTSSADGNTVMTDQALRNLALSVLGIPLKQGPDGKRNSLVFETKARPTPIIIGALVDII